MSEYNQMMDRFAEYQEVIDALLAACRRAEQTFRNLANTGGIVRMGTSLEIAQNELENLRRAIAKAEQ
jgi:hypothetical protein